MKLDGFIGAAYKLDSVNVDCQECVNLYPEVIESGKGKEAQVAYLKSTPGLLKKVVAGSGPIRLIHEDFEGRIFVASGAKMYRLTFSTTWTATEIGDLDTSTGRMKAKSCTGSEGMTVFVDGDTNYLFWAYLDGGTHKEDFGTFGDFGYTGFNDATDIEYIDGYFIFITDGSNQFYVLGLNQLEADPLSFASAEGNPDNIMACMSINRDLWLLNERSIEVFADTGNADFPFERVGGGFIEFGCAAQFSVAKIGGSIFWLGRDELGQGIVYMAQGISPRRISTHAIEREIKGYADMSTAKAWAYQSAGHAFYVLNFAEATWCYDLATGLWHQRSYTNAGELERHRVDCCIFSPTHGIHIVGDYENGNVYQLDDLTYDDDGDAITRMRSTPHISSEGKRVFCNDLSLDMETGIGLDGGVQGSDPQVMLTFSDDGGHTWSNESWTSAGGKVGGIGDFKKRVIWRRLGSFRDRVFRVKITDPVPVTLLSANIDLVGGVS